VIGSAVAIAVIGVVTLRKRETPSSSAEAHDQAPPPTAVEKQPETIERSPVPPPLAAPTAADPEAKANPSPAKSETNSAARPDPTPPAEPTAKPAAKPPAAEPDVVDESAAQKLKDAEDALRDGTHDRAEQLANSIITSEVASRTQKAQAHTIRGVVYCVAHNNEERARIALRQLAGYPRLRKRLVASCQDKGLLTVVE